jgi:hypothetical protein
MLVEYSVSPDALKLVFEFNPTTITRSRTVTVRTGGSPGSRGGYDFQTPEEVPRAAQGVSVQAESLSLKILLDATDRMHLGDPNAYALGIEPQIDVLRSMVEPKAQSASGSQTLAALGQGTPLAFSRHEYCSVLVFKWGPHVLPVFLTQVQVESTEFLPSLVAYRAEATLSLQVIESRNPFYDLELRRQFRTAQAASAATPSAGFGGR